MIDSDENNRPNRKGRGRGGGEREIDKRAVSAGQLSEVNNDACCQSFWLRKSATASDHKLSSANSWHLSNALVAWCSGNTLCQINEVTLDLPGWVNACRHVNPGILQVFCSKNSPTFSSHGMTFPWPYRNNNPTTQMSEMVQYIVK